MAMLFEHIMNFGFNSATTFHAPDESANVLGAIAGYLLASDLPLRIG
jgi:hypothetical protein